MLSLFNIIHSGLRFATNVFLIHYLLDKFCPAQYRYFLLVSTTGIIYYYSYAEMRVRNYIDEYPRVKNLVDSIDEIFKKKRYEIEFIKFSQVSHFTTKNELLSSLTNEYRLPFDFMIYSFSSKDEKVVNRCLYYTLDDVENKLTNCEKCNYTFFSVEVVVQLENGPIQSYNLPLKTEHENYYMVGNKINRVFICYLLYQKYSVEYDSENIVYSLNLLDNLVRMSTLNELDCILFGKEDYSTYSLINVEENNKENNIEHYEIEYERISDNDSMPELEEIIENEREVERDEERYEEKIIEFQEELEKLKMEIQEIEEAEKEPEKEAEKEAVDENVEQINIAQVEPIVELLCLSDTSDTSETYELVERVGPTEKKKRGRPRNSIKL